MLSREDASTVYKLLKQLIPKATFSRIPDEKVDCKRNKEEFESLTNLLLKKAHVVNKDDIYFFIEDRLLQQIKKYGLAEEANKNKDIFELSDVVGIPLNKLYAPNILHDMSTAVSEEMMTLPKQYEVLIPLMLVEYIDIPNFSWYREDFIRDRIRVSEGIELLQMTDELMEYQYPTMGGFYDEDNDYVSHPLLNYLYVSIKLQGWPNFSLGSSNFKYLLRTLYILLASLIVNRVVKSTYDDDSSDYSNAQLKTLGYYSDINGPGYYYVYPSSRHEKPSLHIFESKEKYFLRSLFFNELLAEPSEFEKKSMKKGKDSIYSMWISKLREKLNNAGKLFIPGADSNKDLERIRTSLEWFIAGFTNENRTFSYIQYAIALEALLGDKRSNNIVERLSDRCAYIIANKTTEREIIRKEITKAYAVRSEIIHEGQPRIAEQELENYFILKKYLQKALFIEISSLPDSP